MKRIAIIPARGGSKRIPGKNLKNFAGKPIIGYSIEAAIESNLFDEVMVSTDDAEIAEVSKKFGANVPFFRSKKNSDDFATTEDVLREVIDWYKAKGENYEYCCCIYPTAPLLKPSKLIEAFILMGEKKFDAVFPIIRYGYPILRSLKLTEEKVQMNWPEYSNTRSQDLVPAFHDSGQFYWFFIEKFLKTNEILTDNCGGIEVLEIEAQDIDTEIDWKLAELKYKLLNSL